MRLFTGLYSARESLLTHGTALSAIADNVSNANTPGYKTQRAEFCDLLSAGEGCMFGAPLESGNGVSAADITTMHSLSGSIEETGRELDVAIDGRGYFILEGPTATQHYYTRSGNFITDSEGNLMTMSGENVLGYTAESPDTLVPINVREVEGSASPTTTMTVGGNLNVNDPIGAFVAPTTFVELNAASAFSSAVRVIDSLGESHDVALHFFHTDALTWEAYAYVDAGATGGVAGTPLQLGMTQIAFGPDGTQGENAQATLTITPSWSNGSAATPVAIDLSSLTGLSASSNVGALVADGRRAGTLSGVSIENNGNVLAVLDNGEEFTVATLALATFNNPNGLDRVGDNKYVMGGETGDEVIGTPGSDGRGMLRGQSLETSTTDLAKEFVSMIRYQRGYQASSKVATTVSEALNTAINIA